MVENKGAVPFYLQLYVMYVNYGQGITYRTGPVELRHRVGLWAHFYVRDHPPSCQCLKCFRRLCFGPVEAILEGRKPGYMYPLF